MKSKYLRIWNHIWVSEDRKLHSSSYDHQKFSVNIQIYNPVRAIIQNQLSVHIYDQAREG